MNKYVECQNCKNSYDCERTYLGGCTDGKEWEEKKLPDEEIIEELSGCLLKTSCDDCKLDRLECKRLAVEQIHRLQSENEKLRNAKVIYETVDYCAEDLKKAQSEIERLTEENGYLKLCADNFLADYQKVQKQVDELTEERENMQAEIIATEEARLQAVKDTAKEIYGIAVEYYYGEENFEQFLNILKEHYGVEVE